MQRSFHFSSRGFSNLCLHCRRSALQRNSHFGTRCLCSPTQTLFLPPDAPSNAHKAPANPSFVQEVLDLPTASAILKGRAKEGEEKSDRKDRFSVESENVDVFGLPIVEKGKDPHIKKTFSTGTSSNSTSVGEESNTHQGNCRTASTLSPSPLPSSRLRDASLSKSPRVKKIFFDEKEGISSELGGFGHYAGSITAFMDPEKQKKENHFLRGSGGGSGPLPCEVAEAQERSMRSQQVYATSMQEVIEKGGSLPSPRKQSDTGENVSKGSESGAPRVQLAEARKPPAFLASGAEAVFGRSSSFPPTSSMLPGASAEKVKKNASPSSLPSTSTEETSLRKGMKRKDSPSASPSSTSSPSLPSPTTSAGASEKLSNPEWTKEAEDYYRSLPNNPLSKEEMWSRIQAASADKQERQHVKQKKEGKRGDEGVSHRITFSPSTALPSTSEATLNIAEIDMMKMKEELKEHDRWHYQLGLYAFKDEAESTIWRRHKWEEEEEGRVIIARQRRYDYYTMWSLAMALNKARWSMLEVNSQRGVKTTGAGMKLLFWKEAIRGILQSGTTSGASFTDSHPVLQPFARVVARHPKLTKAFVRGFTDARLRTLQQPANMQQLFDHFDKFYGYFYNSLLEVTQLQDEAAEHALLHIGRANGLTQHCVMFWKKYATLGVTLLPADMCADHCVHLGLLKRLSLASRDRAVRRLLCDVMGVAKTEMLHAEKLAKDIHPKTWPILMECFYPNYYLQFLQKRDFNVSAMFADYNIDNMGFIWFRIKKRLEWQREQSVVKLLSDSAPVPIVNRPIFYRGSQYKMATHTRGSLPK